MPSKCNLSEPRAERIAEPHGEGFERRTFALDGRRAFCMSGASLTRFAEQAFGHTRRAEQGNRVFVDVLERTPRRLRPLPVVATTDGALDGKQAPQAARAFGVELFDREQAIDAGELAPVNGTRNKLGRSGNLDACEAPPAIELLMPRPTAALAARIAGADYVRPWGRLIFFGVGEQVAHGRTDYQKRARLGASVVRFKTGYAPWMGGSRCGA